MIIIPTYNERNNIQLLVEQIRKFLPKIPILFVDDNSPDGTGQEIIRLQQTDPNIKLISRPQKAGFASAYLEALKTAQQEQNLDVVVLMDADLSHPPEKISELIMLAQNGLIGIGSRYVQDGGVKNWNLKRRILSRLGNIYAGFLTKLPIYDVTSGFMAIPKDKLKPLDLNNFQNSGYAFLVELKVKLWALGAEFKELPITFEERKQGQSKLSLSIIREAVAYPAKVFFKRQIKDNYFPWIIFVTSLAVYIKTLPRAIYFGDSPEFMATVANLGIPHPPGYPAYVLLAKIFTFLPFGNIEFRIGLFSAICASVSLVLFYFLFQKISAQEHGKPNQLLQWTGFIGCLILGFSNIFWSQAIMAKVYMPMLLLLLIIIWLLLKFLEKENISYIFWSMFLFGLGSGVHEMLVLFFPLVLITAIIYLNRGQRFYKQRFDIRIPIVALVLFGLGLCVYLYLPIRAHLQGNYFNFAKMFRISDPGQSYFGFQDYILRSDYQDLSTKFIWHDKVNFFSSFLLNVWEQFSWLVVLVAPGLFCLWKLHKKIFIFSLIGLFGNILGIILLRSINWNIENEFLTSFYYLPAHLFTAFWMTAGLYWLLNLLKSFLPQSAFLLFSGLLLLVPISLMGKNYQANNLANFSFVESYTKQVLESLPSNAVLLASYDGAAVDTALFGIKFQQIVKSVRPDVDVLISSDIHPELDPKALRFVFNLTDAKSARTALIKYVLNSPSYKTRLIFTTYLADDLSPDNQWGSSSNGLVYALAVGKGKNMASNQFFQINYQKDAQILESNLFGRDLLAQYFYAQAGYWAQQNDLNKAQLNFIQAIKFDDQIMGIDQESFKHYRDNSIIRN